MKQASERTPTPESPRIDEVGPWPFVTRRVHHLRDGTIRVWSSRHHRKGLVLPEMAEAREFAETLRRSLWMPRDLNWWIGIAFGLGSLLFLVASAASLSPLWARALDQTAINATYFAGSIPFTIAAYSQLYQAANAGEFPSAAPHGAPPRRLFAWRPHDIGWLASALQFVGTILFNVNTFDAMTPSVDWLQEDLAIWVPDAVGSVLFLSSGYLAFIETCHAHWAWQPASLSWWVAFANLIGCVGFMVAAVSAVYLPSGVNAEATTVSVLCTLLGALGFFAGSLLMLPEDALYRRPDRGAGQRFGIG